MINDASIGCYLFHYTTDIIFHKVFFDFSYPLIYPRIAPAVADSTAKHLGGINHNDKYTNPLCRPCAGKLWFQQPGYSSVFYALAENLPCFICSSSISTGLCISSKCNHRKSFRKEITSFPDRSSISCYMEEHTPIFIKAILI